MNHWKEILKGWKLAHSFALLILGGLLLTSNANAQKTEGPLALTYLYFDGYYGINIDVTDIKAKQAFNIVFGYLYCPTSEGFKGKLHICLTDKDGKIKEDYGDTQVEFGAKDYNTDVNSYILEPETTAEPGDRIALFAEPAGSKELIPIKGYNNDEVSIPATGYTPRTCEVVMTADEGATVTPQNDHNILYQGKALQGWGYAFSVTPKEHTSKCFVTVDDKFQESVERINFNEDEAEGDTRTYVIYNMSNPSYAINVKTYPNYEEKELDLEVTPGNMLDAINEQQPDFNVYRRLKLKGQINIADFADFADLPFRKIDLSECSVAAFNLDGYGEDCVPMAFRDNVSLDEVVLPKGVKEIGAGAFMNSHIKKITIPASVEKVGRMAFRCTYDLLDVYMQHTTPLSYTSNTFDLGVDFKNTVAKRTLHVPAGCKSAYENSANQSWTQYFGKIVEDVETGIQGIHANTGDATVKDKNKKAAIYDLNGRRILTPAKNQTYIQNGKKFIQR